MPAAPLGKGGRVISLTRGQCLPVPSRRPVAGELQGDILDKLTNADIFSPCHVKPVSISPVCFSTCRLLTGYAVSFNLRHKRAGHLFQNRYKSIVCDDEAYRLELLRYIHLNPLRAGIVTTLDELSRYPWSGHRQLIGEAAYPLLATTELLPLFAKRKKAAARRYLQFLEDGLRLDQTTRLSRGGRRSSQAYNSKLQDDDLYDERILGGGDFVEQVLGAEAVPTALTLSLAEVISRVADYYNLRTEEMAQPCRRPLTVQAKAVICYLATRRMQRPGTDIATQLAYTASAVSKASQRGEKLIQEDKELRAFIEFVVLSRTSR